MCEYWFQKDRARIRDIRVDTLGQMLNLAGVRPGGRFIVVDEASGLLVTAVLERVGSERAIHALTSESHSWFQVEEESSPCATLNHLQHTQSSHK